MSQQDGCCSGGDCCGPAGPAVANTDHTDHTAHTGGLELTRRGLLASTLGAAGLAALGPAEAAAALGVPQERLALIRATERRDAERRDHLRARGSPTRVSDSALANVGMPVGGALAGRVSLGGDGRLWLWDVNNPDEVVASQWEGTTYLEPMQPTSPFRQGFALRTTHGDTTKTRSLDADGFGEVTFTGQYPIGTVDYAADDSPVDVRLEAFSPFIPTATDDSSLPATVCVFTLTNPGSEPIEAVLAGWSESPVCLDTRRQQTVVLRNAELGVDGAAGFVCAAADKQYPDARPDVEFDDFEKQDYQGWTVEGTAFGSGPVRAADVPDDVRSFGDLHVSGSRLVTSYDFRGAPDAPDDPTGKLISAPFTIERNFVRVRVGGGDWKAETCVNVVVDGSVVATATGTVIEPLRPVALDVRQWRGQQATIEIVDARSGGWGHINVDAIGFSDTALPVAELADHGTFAVAAVAGVDTGGITVVPALADASDLDAIFFRRRGRTR